MRRLSVVIAILAVALIGIGTVVTSSRTSAQDAADQHPLVGAWQLDSDTEDPQNPPELAIASADGSWVGVEVDGAVSLGRWESTGPQTANLTVWDLGFNEEVGFIGSFILRATIEVAADGQSFTASYTGEFIQPDGATMGEYGPGTATASRLSVEPMGTPVGSFEELFAQFEGSPEASPAP